MFDQRPSPELLRKLLRYEPSTGKLFWRRRAPDMFKNGDYAADRVCNSWNTRYTGSEAMSAYNTHGYRHGKIFARNVLAHRVIWAIAHGSWPQDQIDHINGNRDDNRIGNLRVVTQCENGKNSKRHANNASGVSGVDWHKASGRWRARIGLDGKRVNIGAYSTKAEAVAARMNAEVKYGYHQNHGRA